MATILRQWSYRYQWLYDWVSRFAAITVGGEHRFRRLALEGLTIHTLLTSQAEELHILDLCCGSGQATQLLVEQFSTKAQVTGLDASPLSLQRAKHNVPQAEFVEGLAEAMPFPGDRFDLVHTSVALHEMTPHQLQQIIQEVHRVLRSGGVFTFIDFHTPTNPLFKPPLAMFLLLFETETAWQLLKTDLVDLLTKQGFRDVRQILHAGGSLQVIRAVKE